MKGLLENKVKATSLGKGLRLEKIKFEHTTNQTKSELMLHLLLCYLESKHESKGDIIITKEKVNIYFWYFLT